MPALVRTSRRSLTPSLISLWHESFSHEPEASARDHPRGRFGFVSRGSRRLMVKNELVAVEQGPKHVLVEGGEEGGIHARRTVGVQTHALRIEHALILTLAWLAVERRQEQVVHRT